MGAGSFQNCWKRAAPWARARGAARTLAPSHSCPTAQRPIPDCGMRSQLVAAKSTSARGKPPSPHLLVHLLLEGISLGEFKPCLEPRWQRSLGNVAPRLPAPKSKGDDRSNSEQMPNVGRQFSAHLESETSKTYGV